MTIALYFGVFALAYGLGYLTAMFRFSRFMARVNNDLSKITQVLGGEK